jgi:inhibitor of KinA sporulation pathway (predicted exonuclease)
MNMEAKKYYLVIDLEATCDADERMPREETEIIEIGAVLCDGETLAQVAEFQTFVRPLRHPRLTPFCTRLTTITQAQVDAAPTFTVAISRLGAWLRTQGAMGRLVFCSWGDYDKNQLAREERRSGIRLPLGTEHMNLKEAFRRRSGDDKKLGNGQALQRVGQRFEGTAHRGIDDARNIARLLPYCLGRLPIPDGASRGGPVRLRSSSQPR